MQGESINESCCKVEQFDLVVIMAHSLVCNQFRPNFWRPSICAYCYRPKDRHNNTTGDTATANNRRGRTLPSSHREIFGSNEWHHSLDVIPRSATVSGTSLKSKERIMYSEPPADLEDVQDFRRIGVVKPYAVVELNNTWISTTNVQSTPTAATATSSDHGTDTTTAGIITTTTDSLVVPPDKKFFTLPNTQSKLKSSSSQTAIVSPNTESTASAHSLPRQFSTITTSGGIMPSHNGSHSKIIPKRKAPPPPDIIGRRKLAPKRSSSLPPQCSIHYIEDLVNDSSPRRSSTRPQAVELSSSDNHYETHDNQPQQSLTVELRHKESSPPIKPPRTESTFITADEKTNGILSDSANIATKKRMMKNSSNYALHTASKKLYTEQKYSSFEPPPNDYEPLRKPGLSFSTLSLVPSCSVSEQLNEVFNKTLTTISQDHLKKLQISQLGDLWNVDWNDITVRTDDQGNHQLFYHMHPIILECYDEVTHNSEISISKSLGPHLNLSLAKGILSQTPTDLIDILPESLSYVIRDHLQELVPLQKLLPEWQKSLNPDEYERHILVTLLQVLRAVKRLYCNGIVHRDLGVDTVYAVTSSSTESSDAAASSVIKLGGFQYSLYRPGPLSATTFVYAFQELDWLGGADTRLPPEIMDTPENSHALDYANTDCFAVGCLIYELITDTNPFDDKPQLVYVGYSDDDLPEFPKTTKMSINLQTLAHRLLRRDPHRRLGVHDALTLIQSMLWLPSAWFQESVSNEVIQNHLLLLKGSLMAEIALCKDELPLELVLKSDFLSSCSASDIVRAFAVFH